MTMAKKKLLIFTEYFLPAKKGGGPVSSIRNIIDLLHEDLEIRVVCFNHDMNSSEPLQDIKSDEWNNWENKAEVFYASKQFLSKNNIYNLIEDFSPNTIYLNAIFVYQFVVFPIWASKKIDAKVVIATRGMLQEGAIANKPLKKKVYFSILRLLGVLNKVRWHATDKQENIDIKNTFKGEEIDVLKNIPIKPLKELRKLQANNAIKLIYLSLVSEKKNLTFLLQALKRTNSLEIEFDIYGPIKDVEYWNECKILINEMPMNIKVSYKGEVNPEDVTETISKYNLFVLPTLGENFGHAIFESFACGVPVLISDKTPWINLEEKNIGYDLALDETLWTKTIESLDVEKLNSMRIDSLNFAKVYYTNGNFKPLYLKLFNN